MKLTVNLGELKYAKIEIPERVIVTYNFDPEKPLGWATLKRDGESMIAELDIDESLLRGPVTCNVGGMVTDRLGSIISGFEIKSVGVSYHPSVMD